MERDASAEIFYPRLRCCIGGTLMAIFFLGLVSVGPVAAQSMMFDDNFEDGHTEYWSQTMPEPRQWCDCYFSGDCSTGNFCNYGPGGFGIEDICEWATPKPSGTPGAGCDALHEGPWGGAICDGYCSPSSLGSFFGIEDRALVIQGVELWRDALLKPAEAGGGPVDPELSAAALALPFSRDDAAMLLGRYVNDLLILAASRDFYDHFCHFEQGHPDPNLFVDLSGDSCRLAAGRLVVDALVAELREPGSGGEAVAAIPAHCDNWDREFAPRCRGLGALDCLSDRVRGMAELLTTPQKTALERLLAL